MDHRRHTDSVVCATLARVNMSPRLFCTIACHEALSLSRQEKKRISSGSTPSQNRLRAAYRIIFVNWVAVVHVCCVRSSFPSSKKSWACSVAALLLPEVLHRTREPLQALIDPVPRDRGGRLHEPLPCAAAGLRDLHLL